MSLARSIAAVVLLAAGLLLLAGLFAMLGLGIVGVSVSFFEGVALTVLGALWIGLVRVRKE